MKFSGIDTRSIVILGYCLLVTLAMAGIVFIYLELEKSHKQSLDNSVLRKELFDLGSTLSMMYEMEETASLIAIIDNEKLKIEYDSLTNRVFNQIDSLRLISTDSIINISLDSLYILLSKKNINALEMFQLTKQIDKNIEQEFIKRIIITKADIDKLESILANVIQVKEDTVQVIAEKRSFLQRVRDVVRPTDDILTQTSKSSVSETKDLIAPLLSDTIIELFQQKSEAVQKQNAKIMQQLLAHQQELLKIKDLIVFHINKIMDEMKERAYQTQIDFQNEKVKSKERSTSLVAIVGVSALIIVIFFMSWTVQSLNKTLQLQKNIQEAKKHAEKLLISREQLIYTITHDIKAPLSSIIGFLDLLMSEVSLTQIQHYYVNNMYSSASHIQDLVRNLLDFHSIEKEQPKLNSIVFLPDSLIHNIYDSFLPLAEKKKMFFDLKSTFPKTETFLSDPYYIRQIVNNLLSNALKYTPEHGRIQLISSLEGLDSWKISVKDTGQGIDTQDQVRIFDEFVRLGKTVTEVEGTGLGLTIAKKLANLLGGTLELESQKGVGSTFTLTVPLIPVLEKAINQPNIDSDTTSGRILFVDDDQIQLNLLSELMKKEGWPCVCCLNAYDALDYIRKTSFDIIFTDIQIPGMEGFELVQRIRESDFPQATTVPIIAFSAGCQKSESEIKDAGFTEFLLKPFQAKQLLEIIEKYTPFKRNQVENNQEMNGFGWQKVMEFVADDKEAAMNIIDSFIEETNKDMEHLKIAFQQEDKEAIKQISHKMLTLMRMFASDEIVSILDDFDRGIVFQEKQLILFPLLEDTLKEAEKTRQMIKE